MKTILAVLFLALPFNSYCQKYALIDRDFKKPILFTDSITISQVSNNYFPVRVKDLDTLVANLNYVHKQLGNLQRSKFKSYRLQSGLTNIKVTTVPHAYGDAYDIIMITTGNNIVAEYLLASNIDLNKKAGKKIDKFTNFILQDKSLTVNRYTEWEPLLLDATVYIHNN